MSDAASKCPYHHQQEEKPEQPSPAEAKCPYHKGTAEAPPPAHPKLEDLKEGDEMCSHARKKLEAQKAAAASAEGEGKFLPQQDWKTATTEDFKAHFSAAYNQVATEVTANSEQRKAQNDRAAEILMRRLGYTNAEMAVIGDDAWVMQGTGNPHVLANIREGETVVDLGSGFGMDAFIAASKVGEKGRVIGVDLSIGEISAALQRASKRRLRNVDFRLGDIEDAPIAKGTVDCAISNGGFCLVPRKPQAFAEIFRMLKPGGRFSISCTTRKKDLDPSLNWPSCMVVFMPLNSVETVLREIGFEGIEIDESNSRMDIWDEVKAESKHLVDDDTQKVTIHRGDPTFDFLKQLDMNEYCARVNIFGRKPE